MFKFGGFFCVDPLNATYQLILYITHASGVDVYLHKGCFCCFEMLALAQHSGWRNSYNVVLRSKLIWAILV